MNNPVFKKELISKMRNWKTMGVITLYGIILLLTMWIAFFSMTTSSNYGGGISIESIQTLTIALSFIQLGLILFIAPAMTSSLITSERQGRTFDMLLCSPLKERSIILGKLSAGLFVIIILLIVSLPFFGILMSFGGIGIKEILLLSVFFLVTALLFGSIGLFASACFKKTVTSTVISYLGVLLLSAGTPILGGIIPAILGYNSSDQFMEIMMKILYINPFVGLMSVLDYIINIGFDIFNNSSSLINIIIYLVLYIMLSGLFLLGAKNNISKVKER